MKVRATTDVATGAGTYLRVGDDEAAIVPWHINFTVEDLPWHVEGVLFTDMEAGLDATPEFLSLSIRQRQGGPPVTQETLIRGVKLAAIKREAIKQTATTWRRVGDHHFALVDAPAHWSVPARATSRRGRKATDDDLRQAAAAYRQVVAAERTDRLVAMKELLNVSTATASRRINAARERGFLTEEDGK